MRTIALINQKGGCGKTTSSVNLAACLAQLGQRTLLVDMDPQGHCAVGLAVPDDQIERSMYDLLADARTSLAIKDITWQITGNLDLAPSNIALVALEQELHGQEGRQDRLAEHLRRVEKDYDFVIIDCPPNVGILTFNAMRSCTEVIIPVETGYFSLHGLAKQLELIDSLRKQCRQEIRVRILATLYDIRTKLAREVLGELREQFGDLLMESTINFNTKLKEAASFGQPITEYDPASKGFKDFQKLAKELMGPPARITLDLSAYLQQAGEMANPQSRTPVAPGPGRSDDDLPEGLEITEDDAPAITAATPANGRESTIMKAARDLRVEAEALARRAAEIRTAAQEDLGIKIIPSQAGTEEKIEHFYGVKQISAGVLFTTQFPHAKTVAVAGDFNGWKPENMILASNGDPTTFKGLVELKPGRYRYRLVIDGSWQADPFNFTTEPNEFGDVNSVLEVR